MIVVVNVVDVKVVVEIYNMIQVNNFDQSRTCGQNSFICISGAQIYIQLRDFSCVELDSKNLRKFLRPQRSTSNCQTLEKSTRIFPFLLVDPK